MNTWTFQFLREKFGHIRQTAVRELNSIRETKEFLLADYIDYLESTEDAFPFYLTNCNFHLGSSMTRDYSAPDLFNCWYHDLPGAGERPHLSWIYLGAKHTTSSLHLDIWDTSAWNAVISGKKLWVFYDPGQENLLYGGKVDPFEPNFTLYPDFKNASPLVCIQNAGDIVFTPSGWWHAVTNLERGISITENFINETNYLNVLACMHKLNNVEGLSLLEKIIEHNVPGRHL